MKDMFYNYEYNLNEKKFPEPLIWHNCHEHPVAFAGVAVPLTNVKGDVLGLLAKRNSDFNIYFCLEDLCGDGMMNEIMDSDVVCNILTKDQKVVLSPAVYKFSEDTLVVQVHATDDTLPYGNYRIDLYAIIQDQKYTIFADTDGILSID